MRILDDTDHEDPSEDPSLINSIQKYVKSHSNLTGKHTAHSSLHN